MAHLPIISGVVYVKDINADITGLEPDIRLTGIIYTGWDKWILKPNGDFYLQNDNLKSENGKWSMIGTNMGICVTDDPNHPLLKQISDHPFFCSESLKITEEYLDAGIQSSQALSSLVL